jgi:hypothetical protein
MLKNKAFLILGILLTQLPAIAFAGAVAVPPWALEPGRNNPYTIKTMYFPYGALGECAVSTVATDRWGNLYEVPTLALAGVMINNSYSQPMGLAMGAPVGMAAFAARNHYNQYSNWLGQAQVTSTK